MFLLAPRNIGSFVRLLQPQAGIAEVLSVGWTLVQSGLWEGGEG